jgi:hypothetical protein
MIVVDAIAAWRDPSRSLVRRLGMALVAAAAVMMACLFFAFDLTNLSTDY